MDNTEEVPTGGYATRSRRKRLESVESDLSSRPGTPLELHSKMDAIPENPTKRITRRNSVTKTPKKTPSKAKNLEVTNAATPTRITRRRSVSLASQEDMVLTPHKGRELNALMEEETKQNDDNTTITKEVTTTIAKENSLNLSPVVKLKKLNYNVEDTEIEINNCIDIDEQKLDETKPNLKIKSGTVLRKSFVDSSPNSSTVSEQSKSIHSKSVTFDNNENLEIPKLKYPKTPSTHKVSPIIDENKTNPKPLAFIDLNEESVIVIENDDEDELIKTDNVSLSPEKCLRSGQKYGDSPKNVAIKDEVPVDSFDKSLTSKRILKTSVQKTISNNENDENNPAVANKFASARKSVHEKPVEIMKSVSGSSEKINRGSSPATNTSGTMCDTKETIVEIHDEDPMETSQNSNEQSIVGKDSVSNNKTDSTQSNIQGIVEMDEHIVEMLPQDNQSTNKELSKPENAELMNVSENVDLETEKTTDKVSNKVDIISVEFISTAVEKTNVAELVEAASELLQNNCQPTQSINSIVCNSEANDEEVPKDIELVAQGNLSVDNDYNIPRKDNDKSVNANEMEEKIIPEESLPTDETYESLPTNETNNDEKATETSETANEVLIDTFDKNKEESAIDRKSCNDENVETESNGIVTKVSTEYNGNEAEKSLDGPVLDQEPNNDNENPTETNKNANKSQTEFGSNLAEKISDKSPGTEVLPQETISDQKEIEEKTLLTNKHFADSSSSVRRSEGNAKVNKLLAPKLNKSDITNENKDNSDSQQQLTPFAKSWAQSFHSKAKKIDTITFAEEKSTTVNAIASYKEDVLKRVSVSRESSVEYEMIVDTEDEEENKDEFIDDQAECVGDDYESGDSMDSEERKIFEENEIDSGGETIGSEDSTDNNEENYDENDSFIASSDDEEIQAAFSDDELETTTTTKKYKRLMHIESDSDDNLDTTKHSSIKDKNDKAESQKNSDTTDTNHIPPIEEDQLNEPTSTVDEMDNLENENANNSLISSTAKKSSKQKFVSEEKEDNISFSEKEKSVSKEVGPVELTNKRRRSKLDISVQENHQVMPNNKRYRSESDVSEEENILHVSHEENSMNENPDQVVSINKHRRSKSYEVSDQDNILHESNEENEPNDSDSTETELRDLIEAAFSHVPNLKKMSRRQTLPLKTETEIKSSTKVKRRSLHKNELSKSFVEILNEESRKKKSLKEKNILSQSFHGIISCDTKKKVEEKQKEKHVKKQSKSPSPKKNKDIIHILQRCNEILSATDQRKLSAKKQKKTTLKKKSSNENASEDIESDMLKKSAAVNHAIEVSKKILLSKPPKHSRKPRLIENIPFESKTLSPGLLQKVSFNDVRKRKRDENSENGVKIFKTKSGTVIETPLEPPPLKRKKHVEILQTKTGEMFVEPLSPLPQKKSHSGFQEEPLTPAYSGWKIQCDSNETKEKRHRFKNNAGFGKVQKIRSPETGKHSKLASYATERAQNFLRSAMSCPNINREEPLNILRRKKFLQ